MTVLVDPVAIRQLWGLQGESGSDLVGELIDLFGANTGDVVADLRESSGRGDAAAAQRHAHSLAGSSMTVGATGVAVLARRIEALARQQELEAIPMLIDDIVALLEPTLARLREERAALSVESPPAGDTRLR